MRSICWTCNPHSFKLAVGRLIALRELFWIKCNLLAVTERKRLEQTRSLFIRVSSYALESKVEHSGTFASFGLMNGRYDREIAGRQNPLRDCNT